MRSTSTGASSEFAAVVNWTATLETPSLEEEVMVSIFGSAATASSMGLVIWLSMVAGSAPGSVVVTRTSGKLTLGVMPTPMDAYANNPRNASATVTAATMSALRIENSVNRTGRCQR